MREVIYYERSHLQLDQMPCHILYSVDYAHPSGAYREISALCAFFYGTFADIGIDPTVIDRRTTPMLSILEKAKTLPESFSSLYQQEEKKRLTLDLENLQKSLLEKGVEEQLEKNIPEFLKKKGIEVTACKVHIEGELLKVCLWTKEVPDGELERGIKDELAANWGIREENCEVLAWENGKQTMGDSSPSGTSVYGNCTSGIQ